MLDAGVIRPSTSSFASAITIVTKENGTLRLCSDYQLINRQNGLFPFSTPKMDDTLNETGICSYFSRIDLCKDTGRWRCRKSTGGTSFLFDIYEYNRVPLNGKLLGHRRKR